MIQIACKHCDEKYELIDKFSGKVIKCQSCGKDISIPDIEAPPPADEQASEAPEHNEQPSEAEDVDTFKFQASSFVESSETIKCPSCQAEWPASTVICGSCHVDMTYVPKPKRKRYKTNPERIEKPKPVADELDTVQATLERLTTPLISIAGFDLSWLRIGLGAIVIFCGYSLFSGSGLNLTIAPSGYVNDLGSDDSDEVDYAFRMLKQKKADALPALIDGLKHENSNVRISVATIIAELGPDGKAAALALAETLQDQDENVSTAGMAALKKLDHFPPEIAPILIKVIDIGRIQLRKDAILCLGKTRDKQTVPILRRLISESSDDPTIGASIAAAVELGSDGATLVPLILARVHPRSQTRHRYLESIVKIGACLDSDFDEVHNKLIELVEKTKDDTNLTTIAIQAIGSLAPKGNETAVPLLIKQLDKRATVGVAAAALSEFGPLAATAIPALEATIETRLQEFADEDFNKQRSTYREQKVSVTFNGTTITTSPSDMGSALRREGQISQAEAYEKAHNQSMSSITDRVNDRWSLVRKGLQLAIEKIQAGDADDSSSEERDTAETE